MTGAQVSSLAFCGVSVLGKRGRWRSSRWSEVSTGSGSDQVIILAILFLKSGYDPVATAPGTDLSLLRYL